MRVITAMMGNPLYFKIADQAGHYPKPNASILTSTDKFESALPVRSVHLWSERSFCISNMAVSSEKEGESFIYI